MRSWVKSRALTKIPGCHADCGSGKGRN